jgi:ketosteroid isomerase-like protein
MNKIIVGFCFLFAASTSLEQTAAPTLTQTAPPTSPAAAAAPPQEPSVALPPELARVLTDYEAAWRRGDGAALAGLFAEDGVVLPNGDPPVRGRASIQKFYKGPGGALVLRALSFSTEGSIGYIVGAYGRKAGDADVGKFTLTLRKGSDGRWLIFSDMDNGNQHHY